MGGEAGQGGGGAAGFDGGGGVEEGEAQVLGGAGLALAGEDAVVTLLHGLPGGEDFDHLGVLGEGEEALGGEVEVADEVVDVAVEGEEGGEEVVVGWRGLRTEG